jgi:hypothetical protein
MIQAYLDESGIHKSAAVCLVGGYYGKKGPWREFDKRWRSTLGHRDFRVPLDKFHAKEAVKKRGFFQKWAEDRHDHFLRMLADAIATCKIHPVCAGLFVDDFFEFSLVERRFMTGATWNDSQKKFLSSGSPERPYFVAFQECLRTVSLHTPLGGRASFYFGVDRPVAEFAEPYFRYLRWRSRIVANNKFGTIGFPLARETPHLQAADLLSYLSYNHMLQRKESRNWTAPPSSLIVTLLRNRKSPDDTIYLDKKLLRARITGVPLPEDKN